MKTVLALAFLTALAACTAGKNPDVGCPASGNKETMTRAQWEACYGHQSKEP